MNSSREGMKSVSRYRFTLFTYLPLFVRIYQYQRNIIKKTSTPIGGSQMSVIKINRFEERKIYIVCILYCNVRS